MNKLRNGTLPPSPRKKKLVGWFCILIALPLGYFTLTRSVDKLRSQAWPTTHAEVVTIDAQKRVKTGAWCVQLRYRYVIDNKAFASSRLSPANSVACYRQKQAAALLRQFQVGARIPIRYDPSDPGKSLVYLDDLDLTDGIFLVAALFLLTAGIGLSRARNGLETKR